MTPEGILWPLANHLWQSTLFVVLVWLLMLALRNNRAAVRHRLWMAASIKFLVPFALLGCLGGYVASLNSKPITVPSTISYTMEEVSEPFAQSLPFTSMRNVEARHSASEPVLPAILLLVWLAGCVSIFAAWLIRWRRVSGIVRRGRLLKRGREVDALRRVTEQLGKGRTLPIVSSDTAVEPGLFGIVRPVLLLPSGIGDQLDDTQLDGIIAHELSHASRRDNVAAFVHMIVQGLFWFHPFVWWIAARLVDERENACDEAVLGLGGDREIYAEAILKVCKRYLATPLLFVSGISGADLKKRISAIMTHQLSAKLSIAQFSLVTIVGFVTVCVPFLLGVARPTRFQTAAQEVAAKDLAFEVASVKLSKDTPPFLYGWSFPISGRFNANNLSASDLIQIAYFGNFMKGYVVGGPGWVQTQRFKIEAKVGEGVLPAEATRIQRTTLLGPMLRSLLVDRFHLIVHDDTREEPVYNLAIAKGGPKLQKAAARDCEAPGVRCHNPGGGPGSGITGQTVSMSDLAAVLSVFSGRKVFDKTGIVGDFDIHLNPWTPPDRQISSSPPPNGEPVADPTSPDLSTVVQELGLKLEASKAVVSGVVIDRIEMPTENDDDSSSVQGVAAVSVPGLSRFASHAPRSTASSPILSQVASLVEPPISKGITPSPVGAQSRVQERPLAFDAVSVKPIKDSEKGSRLQPPGLRFLPGGVESTPGGGVTAKQLIAEAYQLTEHQIAGGPGWIGSDLFSLQAKTEGRASRDEMRPMLQALLSERFKFVMSHVTKEMPVFALIVRKGESGPIRYRSNPGTDSVESKGFYKVDSGAEGHSSGRAATFRGTTMEAFARSLSQLRSIPPTLLLLDRPVIDRTGLEGLFYFMLAWNDDNDLMVALQDELGLRLQSQKAELDTLVIEHIEKPSAN